MKYATPVGYAALLPEMLLNPELCNSLELRPTPEILLTFELRHTMYTT